MRSPPRAPPSSSSKPPNANAVRLPPAKNTYAAPAPLSKAGAVLHRVQAAARPPSNIISRTSYEPNAAGARDDVRRKDSLSTFDTNTEGSSKLSNANNSKTTTVINNKVRVRLPGASSRANPRTNTNSVKNSNETLNETEWPLLEEVRRNSDPTGKGWEEISFKNRGLEPRAIPKIMMKNTSDKKQSLSYKEVARQGDEEERLMASWKLRDERLRAIEKDMGGSGELNGKESTSDRNPSNSTGGKNYLAGGVEQTDSATNVSKYSSKSSGASGANAEFRTVLPSGFITAQPRRQFRGEGNFDVSKAQKKPTLTEQFEKTLSANRYSNLRGEVPEFITPAQSVFRNNHYNAEVTNPTDSDKGPGEKKVGAPNPVSNSTTFYQMTDTAPSPEEVKYYCPSSKNDVVTVNRWEWDEYQLWLTYRSEKLKIAPSNSTSKTEVGGVGVVTGVVAAETPKYDSGPNQPSINKISTENCEWARTVENNHSNQVCNTCRQSPCECCADCHTGYCKWHHYYAEGTWAEDVAAGESGKNLNTDTINANLNKIPSGSATVPQSVTAGMSGRPGTIDSTSPPVTLPLTNSEPNKSSKLTTPQKVNKAERKSLSARDKEHYNSLQTNCPTDRDSIKKRAARTRKKTERKKKHKKKDYRKKKRARSESDSDSSGSNNSNSTSSSGDDSPSPSSSSCSSSESDRSFSCTRCPVCSSRTCKCAHEYYQTHYSDEVKSYYPYLRCAHDWVRSLGLDRGKIKNEHLIKLSDQTNTTNNPGLGSKTGSVDSNNNSKVPKITCEVESKVTTELRAVRSYFNRRAVSSLETAWRILGDIVQDSTVAGNNWEDIEEDSKGRPTTLRSRRKICRWLVEVQLASGEKLRSAEADINAIKLLTSENVTALKRFITSIKSSIKRGFRDKVITYDLFSEVDSNTGAKLRLEWIELQLDQPATDFLAHYKKRSLSEFLKHLSTYSGVLEKNPTNKNRDWTGELDKLVVKLLKSKGSVPDSDSYAQVNNLVKPCKFCARIHPATPDEECPRAPNRSGEPIKDLDPDKTKKIGDGICRAWTKEKGSCFRGENCWYLHCDGEGKNLVETQGSKKGLKVGGKGKGKGKGKKGYKEMFLSIMELAAGRPGESQTTNPGATDSGKGDSGTNDYNLVHMSNTVKGILKSANTSENPSEPPPVNNSTSSCTYSYCSWDEELVPQTFQQISNDLKIKIEDSLSATGSKADSFAAAQSPDLPLQSLKMLLDGGASKTAVPTQYTPYCKAVNFWKEPQQHGTASARSTVTVEGTAQWEFVWEGRTVCVPCVIGNFNTILLSTPDLRHYGHISDWSVDNVLYDWVRELPFRPLRQECGRNWLEGVVGKFPGEACSGAGDIWEPVGQYLAFVEQSLGKEEENREACGEKKVSFCETDNGVVPEVGIKSTDTGGNSNSKSINSNKNNSEEGGDSGLICDNNGTNNTNKYWNSVSNEWCTESLDTHIISGHVIRLTKGSCFFCATESLRKSPKGSEFNKDSKDTIYGDIGGPYEPSVSEYLYQLNTVCGESYYQAWAPSATKENAGALMIINWFRKAAPVTTKAWRFFATDDDKSLKNDNADDELRKKKLSREALKPYRDSGGGTSILDMRQRVAQKYSRIASRESGLAECFWPLFYDWGVLVSNRKKIGRTRPVDALRCSERFKSVVTDLAPCQFGGFVSYITGVKERPQNATEKVTGKASVGRFVGICESSRRLKILTREEFGKVILRNKAYRVKGGELFNPLLGIRSDITGMRSWSRTDYSKSFLTTRKGGPDWKSVKRRITEQYIEPEAGPPTPSDYPLGKNVKIEEGGWRVLEDLMIDDSVTDRVLNRPLSTITNDNSQFKIKTTLFYVPKSESEAKRPLPIPKEILTKLANTDATGSRVTRREALEDWFGPRSDMPDQSIEGMTAPGRNLTRRQQSLLENKLDKRAVDAQTAVWAKEQLKKKEDRITGGAYSQFEAELDGNDVPDPFKWGTEGPNPQPFARIINHNVSDGWCTATFLDGESLNAVIPVDNCLVRPNGYIYSMQCHKTSNSATAVNRFYEMYDVGSLWELEKSLKRSYSTTHSAENPEGGKLEIQSELGPGGRPALMKGEQDLRKLFSKEEILEGDLEAINMHYELNTWEEASPGDVNLFRLVAGREPITIVILRKIKTMVDTSIKLKCRVILLANQLKTIPNDSPFKLDGGSTPAQLTLTCMDVVDIVENREEVTGDGKSAFPSTKSVF